MGRTGAWDPTITNTPNPGREYDDYGFDDSTPSPNYNPGTPGGGSGTPGGQGSGYSQESPANPCTILRMDILRTNHHPLQLEVTNPRQVLIRMFLHHRRVKHTNHRRLQDMQHPHLDWDIH